jgi:hypothetical protein
MANSVLGAAPPFESELFLLGALGELIFKFGMAGLRTTDGSTCLAATAFFSDKRTFC